MNSQWSHFLSVKDTEDSHILSETFTSDLDELVSCVIRSTLWEGSIEGIEVELEFVLGEINTIEGKINPNSVTTTPSGWRGTLHGVLIDVVGWHESNWWVEVISFLHSVFVIVTLSGRFGHLGESAHDSLESIGGIRELA